MNDIILVAPSEISEQDARDYIEEHKSYGEDYLHGSSLLHQAPSYVEWLEQLRRNADEKTVQKDWVVSSTFFAVRESDRRIVGMVDIRHTLNQFLQDKGGHIGYGVRPTERRKGYATKLLEQALAYCAILGIEQAMIACYSDNVGSKKTILNCGGTLERTFTDKTGKTVEVYWATCRDTHKRHPRLLDRDMRPVLFEMFEMSGERMRIMEEFVLCRKCRADAVMFAPDQGIIGFEIKSDRDSLERLEHQIRDYSRFCDYNYLVTGAKFIDHATEILPEFWGIYCITEAGGKLKITRHREATLSPKVRLQNQLKFLWRVELIDIMKRHKLRGYSRLSKSKIRRLLLDHMDRQELKQELFEMMMERDYSIYEETDTED